jgi:hypothetical protein
LREDVKNKKNKLSTLNIDALLGKTESRGTAKAAGENLMKGFGTLALASRNSPPKKSRSIHPENRRQKSIK